MSAPATVDRSRRQALALTFVVTVLSASILAGCKDTKHASYKGIDITGANYGKGFRLTAPDGRERTLADFKGKAVMLFFGFTQCPDVCPTALIRAANIKKLLGNDGDRLQVIFITLDPERDTPEVLKEYTRAFDPSFIGLYGDLKRTEETARDFKAFYKKVPTGSSYTMDHSAFSYVFDPDGNIRLVINHTQSAQDTASDLRQILHP
jgi:protein SCO1/2